MLFEKYIDREVNRRINEREMQKEMWERLTEAEHRISKLEYRMLKVEEHNGMPLADLTAPPTTDIPCAPIP